MAATDVTDVTSAASSEALSHYTRKDVASTNSNLSMDDFFTLLAAQLRYQDMSNPMSNSEMMSQMTQMANLSSITNLSDTLGKVATTIEDAMNSMSQISLSSYATNLLGRTVTVADMDDEGNMIGTTTGIVDGVSLTGSDPYIYVNGKNYLLSHLISAGATPENKDEAGTEEGETEAAGAVEGEETAANS